MNVTNPILIAPSPRDHNLSGTSGLQIPHAVQSQGIVRHDYIAASVPAHATLMNDSEGGWRHHSPFYGVLDDKSRAASSSGLSASGTSMRSKSRSRILATQQCFSVFKGGGIAAQLTPVSKKFAPAFASTHSLVANTVLHYTEQALKEQTQQIRGNLVPKNESQLKGLDSLVDEQLKQVVERINRKKELEKKQRELAQKLLKR